MFFSCHFEYLYWIKTAANTKSANSNHFKKALEMKCTWDTRCIKYHKFNVTGDFSSSVLLEQSKWSSGCYSSYTWFVSLFCVKNYGTEAASCVAFPWVFQNEIIERLSLTSHGLTSNGKWQKWNFCRLSLALWTVEWKYLYLWWIVGDIFRCALIIVTNYALMKD